MRRPAKDLMKHFVKRSLARAACAALTTLGCSSAPPPAPMAAARPPAPAAPPMADVAAPTPPVRVVEMRNESSPLVTIRVVFRSGSADDPAGKEGLTRLTARLMAEGGTRDLTFEQFTRRLFPMAAELRYQVDRDMTVFVAQVHRDHLQAFYPLLRDVLLAPRLGEDDFARVKTQSLADLRLELRGSSDETLGKELLQSAVYANHPYGHPAVGTERALESATLEALRDHREHVFCASRVTVGLAGGYPESLAETVRGDLANLPARCAPPGALPAVERPRGMHVVIVDKPASSSTAISVGTPVTITRADPDFAAVQLATSYLGLHRQSVGVLYQTLREARGLNYGDYAYAENFAEEPGSRFPRPNILRRQQIASLWIRPVPARNAHFALRAAMRTLDRAVREGVPQADIERVRGFLDGYVGLYTQTGSARLGFALDDVLVGAPQGSWAERTRAAMRALDADAVRAAVQRHLSARDVWVAIVAPNAQELATAIGSNAPSPITYDSPKPAEVVAEDVEISAYPLPVRPDDVRVVPLAEVFR